MSAAAPIFICNQNDGRDQWLQERTTGIGSSDAPCILGLETAWGSPFSVSCTKRGLTPPEPDQETELMKWGHYVEPAMIAAFSDETKLEAKLSGNLYRSSHPDLGFMMTTLDGQVVEGGKVGGVECKLAIFSSKDWERYGIPEHVLAQNQHTMKAMEWNFLYTLALLDGYKLRYKRMERSDEVLGDIMIPAETEFWGKLQDGETFDAGIGRASASASWLKHLHPDDDGSEIALAGSVYQEALDRMVLAKEQEKAAKKEAAHAKNTLVQGIGDATFGRLDDGRRMSFKTQDVSGGVRKASKHRRLIELS